MNQILTMVIRLITRKLLSKGIDAGFNKAASMRSPGAATPRGKSLVKGQQTRQALKLARRISKL